MNIYELYTNIFKEAGYTPSISYLVKLKSLIENYGEEAVAAAMLRLSDKLIHGEEDIENRVKEFFNKLDTVAHQFTLPRWMQLQKKLISFMNSKFAWIGKGTHEINVQNLIGVLQENSCDDVDVMERKIKEACKLVYPANNYEKLLNDIERLFQF